MLWSIILYLCLLAFLAFLFKLLVLERLFLDDYENKAVLITGCDTGFGKKLALKCLEEGLTVFAACLTENGIADLKLKSKYLTGSLFGFQMDVGDDKSVENGKTFVTEQLKLYDQELFAVVNNAGISGNTMYDDFLTIDDYIRVVNINTFGTVRVTKSFKDLVKKSCGRIVLVVSVLGRVSLPGSAPYAVSKFGVTAYGDALRLEMKPFNVDVLIVEPGFFSTNIIDPQRMRTSLDAIWKRTPEQIQDEYGTDFFYSYKLSLTKWFEKCSTQIDWVTNAMFHAITAKYPRLRYNVGYDAIFQYIPSTFLTTRLQDAAIQLFIRLEKGHLPPPTATLDNKTKLK